MNRLFEVSQGVNLFDGSGRDCFFEQINMAGLKTAGVWFDNSTPVELSELEPYYTAKGFEATDPLVTRLQNGFASGGEWTFFYDGIGDRFVPINLDDIRPFRTEAGYTHYYADDWNSTLGSVVDESGPGSYKSVYNTLWRDEGLLVSANLSSIPADGSTIGKASCAIVACVSWTDSIDRDTILGVYPGASERFLEYSANPDLIVDKIMTAYGINKFVEIGTYSIAEYKEAYINGSRSPSSYSAFAVDRFFSINSGNFIVTPLDLHGRFKLFLVGVLHPGGARYSTLSAGCVTSIAKGDNAPNVAIGQDGGSDTTPATVLTTAEQSGLLGLGNVSGFGSGTIYGQSSTNHAWRLSSSTFSLGAQRDTQATYISNFVPATFGTNTDNRWWVRFTSTDLGWGRTMANGFEDVNLFGASYILALSDPYPTIEVSPSRVCGRVQSETLIGLIDDVKNKPGISATDVANLDSRKEELAANPTTFSCTFEAAGILPPTAAEVEATKLWRTIVKEKNSLLTDDLGDGVTLKKGKDKLNKLRLQNKRVYAVCSSAETDEKTDFLVTNDAALQAIVVSESVVISDVGSVESIFSVAYDGGNTYTPDEATLQYIIAATSPSYVDTDLATIEANFGWASGWQVDALDYVGAGYFTGTIGWNTNKVAWDKIATESFVTSDGFPKISFDDDDTRARAFLAFKGLRDDGASFFFGSFFAQNV